MTSHRIIAAAAALTLAAAPAALAKKPADAGAKGKEKSELKGQNGKGKGKTKAKNIVAHGSITAIDGDAVTIAVSKANRHGRNLTTLTITVKKVSVADVNGDRTSSLADFATGDKVVAHSKGGKLISVSHPEAEEGEESDAPAPAPAAAA